MSILARRRIMNLAIVLSLLIPLIAISQVKIKEKVEINPKAPLKNQSTGKPHERLNDWRWYGSYWIDCSPDTLLLGSSAKIVVTARDINGNEIIPAEDYDLRLYILDYQGSFSLDGVDTVRGTVTVPYSVARAGRVQYIAGDVDFYLGDCSAVDVELGVRQSSDYEKGGSGIVTVAIPYCARVLVDPPKLAPGQTATLRFEKTRGSDMYDVSILANDSTSGVLVSSSGVRGIALQGVTGTVQYVAPASISADSVVVRISASSYGICEGMNMQSSVGLPAKKLPGVAATQSLRSGPPAVAHVASLQKKSAGHSMRLPLTAGEQHALMLSIAKRVAEDACPLPTPVVVVTGDDCEPSCQDLPVEYDIPPNNVPNQTICNDSYFGVTEQVLFPDQFVTNVCFSKAKHRWEVRLQVIKGQTTYGLCFRRVSNAIDINGAYDSRITKDNYREVIDDLRIQRDYLAFVDYTYEPKFWSSEAVLKHEDAHVKDEHHQIEKAVEGKIRKVVGLISRLRKIFEPKRTPCNVIEAEMLMKERVNKVIKEFGEDWAKYERSRTSAKTQMTNKEGKKFFVSSNEKPAITAANDFYNDLIKGIGDRFAKK